MENEGAGGMDRRMLVQSACAVAGLLAFSPGTAGAAATLAPGKGWEWEPMRWVQICATEDDPQRYDPEFWMGFLRRTSAQGVCLSAGGVTAFFHQGAVPCPQPLFGQDRHVRRSHQGLQEDLRKPKNAAREDC